MKQNLKILAISGLIGTFGLAGFAYVDSDELQMLSKAKISLTQAIESAEKHIGGTAYEAGIEDDSFKPEFEVSVAKEGKTFEVTVDGVSGEVLGSREDRND